MTQGKAFLFDLNGTMIDDMNYHITEWHRILNELGAGISLERMKTECYGNNHELLERMFPGRFTKEEKNTISYDKERQYQYDFRPQLKLINGLSHFLDQTRKQKIPMAIGSAAIMFNIDFVLDSLNIRDYFNVLVSADDVNNSKPHPETWLKCAERLNINPASCIVFEDSPKGVLAAESAGMKSVVITTIHTKEEFSEFKDVIDFIIDFTEITPQQIS